MQKGGFTKQRMRSIGGILWRIAGAMVLFSIMLMLLLRWVPPPTSAFMVWQRFSGMRVDYRWIPLERVSPFATLAVISSEDQNFFNHHGLDLDAIADAIQDNKSRARPRGASTISQQVVKNLFLWPGRSYFRKGIEVYLTLLMEVLWPKQRILEIYLNIAEMGTGVFGVEAAAWRFFSKPAVSINMHEAATLAAVLPNPKTMSAGRPSEYVRHRTWQIIEQMNALGGKQFLKGAGL